MKLLHWIKREYTIDNIMINAVLSLYAIMAMPHAVALLSALTTV